MPDASQPDRNRISVYDVSGAFPDVGTALRMLCRKTLLGQHLRITHCLSQLSEARIWWRPRPGMNSIANLMLHLRGNVGQWIVAGFGGREFMRDRPGEFAADGDRSKQELESGLAETVNLAADLLSHGDEAALLEPIRVQGFDTTRAGAAMHATTHFEGHAQEIVALTRLQLGESYRPLWFPTTPEQGS